MPLQPGARLGSYELLAPIGAGGMGAVWRARDTKLGREVALKFLTQAVATDPDRLARFRREAQLLAVLNHPNIAAIYGLEEADGAPFLVLELVEGEDLAARLKRGPLPLDEALDAARHVAEALEEAHERGIVHRDLKPGNVKLTPDGKTKVLDFGLAKAWSGELATGSSSSSDLSQSPTLARTGTEAGLILGTAAYMSPEQARGKKVDKRSDVWSFGALVYEMLTGRRLFDGETVSDVLAAVLTRQPEWTALPPGTPPSVKRLLERCLERDAKLRLRDIGEARIALVSQGNAADAALASPASSFGPRTWLAAGAGVVAALLLVAAYERLRPRSAVELPVRKLELAVEGFTFSAFGKTPAIAPGGERVLYHASDRLFVRELSGLQARELPQTEGALYASWSPDGRSVAYVERGRLWTVAVDGGQPSEVGAVPADLAGSGGTAWSEDGLIVAAGSDKVGLFAIPAKGGEGRDLAPLDRSQEADYHEVSALPGGRGFLFTVHRQEGLDTISVLANGTRRVLLQLPGESLRSPVYSSTGHILYRRESTSPGLWAIGFSLDTLAVSGAPFSVLPGGSAPSVATDGTLALVRASETPSELVWVGRDGTVEKAADLPGPANDAAEGLAALALSVDGRRAAVNLLREGYGDIWVCDLARGSTSRLMSTRSDALGSAWTPDGHVIFSSLLGGRRWNLWRATTDGGAPERLSEFDGIQNPLAVSLDGRFLAYAQGAGGVADLFVLPLDGTREGRAFQQTPAKDAIHASFSPDGRFLAYESDETGRSEVYVRPFPEGEGRWQVSTEGGAAPAWSRAAPEILFRSRDRIMAARLTLRGKGLEVDKPRSLFVAAADLSHAFSVAPDGSRLLMTRSRARDRITLVLNWPKELARLAAAGGEAR
jgi:Tol biopolymer transport system component